MARVSAAERRTELAQAALRVIDKYGVHAASTRAIVAEAGMPLASFHYAVKSRDELIREVFAAVITEERAAALGSLTSGADLRSTLRAGLQAYLDLLVARPSHEQAMFELFHYSLRTPELADLPAAQYVDYHAMAQEMLEVAAQHSGMVWQTPIADVARMLIAFTDGATLAWLADRDGKATARTLDLAADALAALAELPTPRNAPNAE